MSSLKKFALAQQDYVIKIRRLLHRNPGLRFNTGFTRKLIVDEIKSAGGHAGMPETGTNALRVANDIMNCLNLFISGHNASSEPAILEPVILNAGRSSNVMPADAELWCSYHTF
jgi:metal-dependent amidase/aminoacylase/carboxypeptidase family protein